MTTESLLIILIAGATAWTVWASVFGGDRD